MVDVTSLPPSTVQVPLNAVPLAQVTQTRSTSGGSFSQPVSVPDVKREVTFSSAETSKGLQALTWVDQFQETRVAVARAGDKATAADRGQLDAFQHSAIRTAKDNLLEKGQALDAALAGLKGAPDKSQAKADFEQAKRVLSWAIGTPEGNADYSEHVLKEATEHVLKEATQARNDAKAALRTAEKAGDGVQAAEKAFDKADHDWQLAIQLDSSAANAPLRAGMSHIDKSALPSDAAQQ